MKNHRILHISILLALIALLITSNPESSSGSLRCPQIGPNMRPALLVEEQTDKEERLWIVYWHGGELHRESILSGNWVDVTQLDNAVLLLSSAQSEMAGSAGSTYVLDFNLGKIKQISETPGIRCLRSEPSRKTAMLIDSNSIPGEDRLIELDLTSLTTHERQVLSKASLGYEYYQMVRRMHTNGVMLNNEDGRDKKPFRISPDFLHIAYTSNIGKSRSGKFLLKSLNLTTLKTEVLDSNVNVEIPDISSYPQGYPPFDWINSSQVLYQHMEGSSDRARSTCAFKIADIKTKEVLERFRIELLQMELNGGCLETEPWTGHLILNNKYILDYIRNQITDRFLPFTVVSDNQLEKTVIRSADKVLYSGNAMCSEKCISASRSSFAYKLLPSYARSTAAELYAVFGRDTKPLRVDEGYSSSTRPIGWIQ
jgi:hypothetical protein